jgi:hypothetical protein
LGSRELIEASRINHNVRQTQSRFKTPQARTVVPDGGVYDHATQDDDFFGWQRRSMFKFALDRLINRDASRTRERLATFDAQTVRSAIV